MIDKKSMIIISVFIAAGLLAAHFGGLFALPSAGCKVAWPSLGTLKCERDDSFTGVMSVSCDSVSCKGSYACEAGSPCTISQSDINIKCGTLWSCSGTLTTSAGKSVTLGTETGYSMENCRMLTSSGVTLSEGETVTVQATCGRLYIYNAQPAYFSVNIADNHKNIHEYNIDVPGGSKLLNTQQCTPQTYFDRYKVQESAEAKSLIDLIINPITGQKAVDPAKSKMLIDVEDIPTSMKVGATYTYFYRWVEVLGINIKYDSSGKPVYCGSGTIGARTLYNYEDIYTGSGQCYMVPTSLNRVVDCCSDADCATVRAGTICGPGFTCTAEKYCISDIECGTTEKVCRNKQETSWSCDTSTTYTMPDGSKKGVCKSTIKSVKCCPNDCPAEQHCDPATGCVPDYVKIDCPAGQCCPGTGGYEVQSCAQGLKCCMQTEHTGLCQADCGEAICGNTICEAGEAGVFGSCPDDCVSPPVCGDGKCEESEKGKCIADCPEEFPLDVGRVIAVILGAAVFGAIAYVWKGSKEIAIAAGIAGGVLIFWWTSLAWWQQALFGIAGGGMIAIVIVLVVIGALAFSFKGIKVGK